MFLFNVGEGDPLVTHPAGAQVLDLGDTTLLPGLIDAHVHLFLHPGAEDLQTVQESIPQRTIVATLAARDDLRHALGRDQVVNDRATRLLRELANGDQCRDRAWRHRLTALVHYEAAVRVAIERHTGIRADFAHLRLQVDDVRRVEWLLLKTFKEGESPTG